MWAILHCQGYITVVDWDNWQQEQTIRLKGSGCRGNSSLMDLEKGEKKREVETNLHWRNNVFCEKLKKSEDGADGRTKYVEMEATKEVNVSNRGRVELKLLQTGGTSRSNWWRAVSPIVGCEFLHGDLHEEIYLNSGCGNRKISGLQTQEVNLWPTTVSRNMI